LAEKKQAEQAADLRLAAPAETTQAKHWLVFPSSTVFPSP
jgi:hypothetical protein